jgi:hypothetical protein
MLAAVAAVAAGLPTPAGTVDFLFFRTPSHNVACVRGTARGNVYLRCDILSGLRPRVARPRGCRLDWGFGYTMSAAGRAVVTCAGDSTNEPGARVIPYGTTWRLGPFRCTSRRVGLRCRNAGGHGFFLSRARSFRF